MGVPAIDYRKTLVHRPEKVTTGLDAVLDYVVGLYQRAGRHGAEMRERADRIHTRSLEVQGLSEHKLKSRLDDCRAHFRRQGALEPELIDETLALLAQAAGRTLGMHPYPVQLMCALALDSGYLAEMGTGEGKSLTATLAGVMAAWTGRPCHVLTTNDYLAARDAVEFEDFYHFCGVDAGAVISEMEPANRQEVYKRGIVYTTSKELLADFLRDRLRLGALHHPSRRLLRGILEPYRNLEGNIVLRGIDTAIVDEADSVIVDEAVTPLIISAQQENKWLVEAAKAADEIADDFLRDIHFTRDDRYREIEFTNAGYSRMDQLASRLPGIWRGVSRREEILRQALMAREFYKLDQHYVIQDGRIVIVDEFTGRLMANRSWGNGLHQAVEAKEGVELTNPTETMARLSFQRFFRLFRRLSGMTGTAREASAEFWHIYRLPVMSIPTNRPVIREVWDHHFFFDGEAKFRAIMDEILAVHEEGRPVLVGTRTVKSSQKLASMLDKAGLSYRLLNAVNHAEEARLVRSAGEEKAITIATNMAGRGTDIKLSPSVANRGGLHVIVAERNDSGRIDRQLIGRCARQGDPGTTRSFAALDDDLLDRFAPKSLKRLAEKMLERDPVRGSQVAAFAFNQAQGAAQRLAYRQRKTVLRTDTWLDEALIFAGSDGIN